MEAGNAKKYLWCVYRHENWKITQRQTGSFFWPLDPACGPPSPPTYRRVTGSNSRSSRPQRSEPEKKNPIGKETRETLKEMGFSGDGSSRSECPNECQNVSQHPMRMSIGAVLVLLVLTHIRARRILNLELLPQFNWRIPQIAIWVRGRQLNLPHLHSEGLNRSQICRPHMQSASEFCVHSNLQRRLGMHETSRSEQLGSGNPVGSSER